MRPSSERTTAVKRALRALTTGTAPSADTKPVSSPSSPRLADSKPTASTSLSSSDSESSALSVLSAPPAAVIERAHEALADVESAAAFVADGGDDRLRAAVEAAERTGDRTTARAGQRALAIIERYRRAAAGDHFHPGRGTVFRPGSQPQGE